MSIITPKVNNKNNNVLLEAPMDDALNCLNKNDDLEVKVKVQSPKVKCPTKKLVQFICFIIFEYLEKK